MNFLKLISKKIRGIGRRIGLMDDFDWSVYNQDEYAKQIADFEKNYTFVLPDGKFEINGGKIILDKTLLPLNEHHQALYEAIYALKPDSVLEIGFGAGDHLYNIKKLLPQVKLKGIDLLESQLAFLKKRHPELPDQAELYIKDITVSPIKELQADLVYTQAVIMHIQRHSAYLQSLKHIFYSAQKYIVLQENWTRHNFFEDIEKISKESDFPWKNIYFYLHDTGHQIAMIVSKTPLAGFLELKSNNALLKYYH